MSAFHRKNQFRNREEIPEAGLHQPQTIIATGAALLWLALAQYANWFELPIQLVIGVVLFSVIFLKFSFFLPSLQNQ